MMMTGLAMVAACSDDGIGPPRTTPPQVGAGDDLRFTVAGVQPWYLIGNEVTPTEASIDVTVTPSADPMLVAEGVDVVDVWVADHPGQRLTRNAATGEFTGTLDIGELPAGDHEILFAYNGKELAFARRSIRRTYPLYFMMTTDWDYADPGDMALQYHDQLRAMHPGVQFTMFVGPYTYTNPDVTSERKDQITAWLKAHRDQNGDELGLHIHPYCNFVVTAGLTCITNQSDVYAEGDASGYTIKLDSYGQAGMETLLDRAIQVFADHGLGRPVTFRAGGWTASSETLAALANKGFVADTSANNWMRMEEWRGQQNGELYRWNMVNWSQINDISQPYYPNTTDKQSATVPSLTLLEVPDNAIMVDYVTRAEMVDIFKQNWDGNALTRPTMFMMGFHPSTNLDATELSRLDGILAHADQFLASNHAGPVVYGHLRDMPKVWQRAQ
jgi:hypothetical protein